MNVELLQMDPAEAERRLEEYRRHRRTAADTEYQRARDAYAELAKGTPLLTLSSAIGNAPRDEKGRPRLAIARADRRQVHFFRDYYERRRWLFNTLAARADSRQARLRLTDLAIAVEAPADAPTDPRDGFALVPIVPPAVLGNRSLKAHFILWEVEAWADSRIGASPDVDPYLLRRIADDLFAVVGEWELTDVERMVMIDRRRA